MPRIKPRSTTVLIYQGDDFGRLSELNRAVRVASVRLEDAQRVRAEAEESGTLRVGDDLPSVDEQRAAKESAEAAYTDFVNEAAERAVEVTLRTIGRRRFTDLVAEHGPRMVTVGEGETATQRVHQDDAGFDVNVETFPMALLAYAEGNAEDDVATVWIADDPFKSNVDRTDFLSDELDQGDFQKLWVSAYFLNREPSSDPKDVPSYRPSPSSPTT